MLPAIFGLLGVLVGAVMTGAVNYVLERRRELGFILATARELTDDLVRVGGLIDVVLKDGDWVRWIKFEIAGRLDMKWSERRPAFTNIRFNEFTMLSRVMDGIEMARAESPSAPTYRELTDEDRARLGRLARDVFDGLRILAGPADIQDRRLEKRGLRAFVRRRRGDDRASNA